MWKLLKNSQGLSLMETMVGVVITGVAITGVVSVVSMVSQEKMSTNLSRVLQLKLSQALEATNSSQAWLMTIAANPTLSCLEPSSGADCRGVEGPIILKNSSNETIYDNVQGFNLSGQPCDGFDAITGNSRCPFRYEIRWRALCPAGGSCKSPQVQVIGKLKFNDGSKTPPVLNPAKYSFNVVLGQEGNSLRRSCEAVGGTFSASSGTCQLPLGSCPSGQVVIGVNSTNNQAICKPLLRIADRCPAGLIAVGLRPNGYLHCEPRYCPPKPTAGVGGGRGGSGGGAGAGGGGGEWVWDPNAGTNGGGDWAYIPPPPPPPGSGDSGGGGGGDGGTIYDPYSGYYAADSGYGYGDGGGDGCDGGDGGDGGGDGC